MSTTLPIGYENTIAGSPAYSPQATGTFYLRKDPFSTNTYSGTYIGGGSWDFGNVDNGSYQLWNASSQLTKYGTFYIMNNNPIFSSLRVLGDVSVTGQVNFFNSFNMNGADLAHADNIQVNSLSENVGGAGVRFDHKISLSDPLRIASNLPGLNSNNTFSGNNTFTGNNTLTGQTTFGTVPTYYGAASVPNAGFLYFGFAKTVFGQLGFGNNWTANNNFSQYPIYNGSGSVTLPKQFTTKEYVDNAVLTANFGSITASFVNQVSTNVIRLLANGTYSTQQKVAPTWALAMKMGKESITGSSSSATKQMIIQIEGIGETSTSIPITDSEIGTYFYPNVHINGVSQSVTLYVPDDNLNSGTDASKCLIEDLTLFHNDDGATPSLSNITFKDCYFNFHVGVLSFTNCMFKGTNIIKFSGGTLNMSNVSGTTYYTTTVPNETDITPPFILSAYL